MRSDRCVLMRGVTATERLFHRSGLRLALRPVAGGILVGAHRDVCAACSRSGHHAIALLLQGGLYNDMLAIVLVGKIAASALSIGAGYPQQTFFNVALYRRV